ncbi:hypothetical protein CPB86DRAFT_281577 [Serendipita vermifera]|nr:hypothetical protein CPB86DRAFT_281577 [Serendipita vermifera]
MFFCDTEGIDTLAKATLCGIQNWLLFLSKAEISMSDWFDALQKFLELILRPESRDLLPKSWYEATKKLQEYSRDQWKYESHYSTNRKTADDLMDDGQEKSKDSTENLNNKEQDAIQEPSAHQANHIESFAKIVETKEITVKKAFFNPNPKEPETPYSTEAEMILLKGLRTSALASGDDHSPLMKGTQQAILREAGTWLSDMTAPQIFWVRDTAGSGKSTVALHLAREWKIQARLAGRFFFGRALGETHTTRYFFTTIAQQGLSYLGPQVRSTICSGINRLGDPISATLEEQCMELFVKPLKATSQPVVVVMDALDECDSHDLTQLLNVMLPQLPNLPHLKLFLSSRPEDHIQRAIQIPYMQVSLSADEIHNFQDTDTFIRYSLRSVNLPPRAIERLTEKSEGNFIWAKIVCDLLVRMKGDHKSLLEDLLAHPLSMDQLYTHCLRISTSRDGENENIDAYKKVLGLIASASEPLSPRTIDELLNIDNSLDIVQDLQILLICRNYNEPVSLIHPTFHEFLLTSLSRW